MPPPESDTAVANDRSVEDEVINKVGQESGGELFIVNNSDSEWKGLKYLQDWTEIANAFEKHIKNTHLKKVQAPVGVKPTLKCWMELN